MTEVALLPLQRADSSECHKNKMSVGYCSENQYEKTLVGFVAWEFGC
jgi:hypothetical protein